MTHSPVPPAPPPRSLADRANKPKPEESQVRALFRDEAKAELNNALTTPAPFRERLVWFWANHFTVSVRGGIAAASVRLSSRRRSGRTSPAASRTCCSLSCTTRRCCSI